MNSAVLDRVEGILFGLAAGDRNGGPLRMAVRLAESLAETRRFDPQDAGLRYLQWWRDGAFDTGPITAKVLQLVDDGMSYANAAVRVDRETGGLTAGCNPAHRCPPLAMSRSVADEQLCEAARREAALTHFSRLAGDTAAAVALLCRLLVNGESWTASVKRAGETVGGRIGDLLLSALDGEGAPNPGGFSPDVLAAALHFLGAAETFAQAVGRSIEFAGPANFCPVLVGSIGGARWGRSAIGEDLLGHCEIQGRIGRAAERLSAGWGTENRN